MQNFPLHYARDFEVVLQGFHDFASCNDVVCSDTHTCSSRASSHTQLTASMVDPKVLHVVLPMTHNTLCVDPHARCQPWTHPNHLFAFFFFSSFDSVHHCNGTGELSLRLNGVVQVELVLHKGHQKRFRDIFSCELGPRTPFCIWSNSSCLFVKKGRLFFLLSCTDWRNSVRLSFDHRPREQVPKHHLAITAETLNLWRHMPPSVIRARRRPRGR